MAKKPTYDELQLRINELEQESESRRELEVLLKESQYQFEQYLAIAGVLFVALDSEEKITLINDCGLETLGYRREELLGKNWFQTCLPERHRKEVLEVYHELMRDQGKLIEYYENPVLRKDGAERFIAWHNTILHDQSGKVVGILSSGEDITERKRMETTLRESEEKYRSILENISDSYLEVDLQGNFRFFNDSFCTLMGYPEEELYDHNNRDFLDETNTEKVLNIFSRVYQTRKPAPQAAWEITRQDGSKRDIEATISLIIDEQGQGIGFRGIGRDVTDRKKTEAALRQSEARFKDISLSMADWIWEVDKDGKYIFSAGNLKDTLGYNDDEILGKSPFDFMPKAEATRVQDIFAEAIAKQQPIIDVKNWNLRKDGSRVCLLSNGVPIINEAGELLGYRGVDKDITSALQAEEKLKASLEVTEKIIETIPIGMVIVNQDKIIKRINKAALEIIGHDSSADIVDHPCHKNICPADKGKCPIVDLGQVVNRSEKVVVHKDGRHIPVLKTALPVVIGDETVIIEAFMDISELKTAENAFRESEERLRTIMQTIVDPIAVYDNQGKATYINPAFTNVFGWSAEELLGRRIDFVPDDATADTRAAITRVLQGERLTGFESQRFTKDGRKLAVRLGAALLLDSSSQANGIVVICQDITQEKEAKDDLNRVNQELHKAIEEANRMAQKAEIANAAKSEFLANMSHEIRTPMNGIIGMTDLVLGTNLSQEQRKYLEMSKLSADSLLGLINDILDFSKIEAGKVKLEAIDFNLRNTLENATATLALKAHEKELEIACHIRPDVPTALIGDPARLRQIIINLTGNALKFTEEGEIVIRVEMVSETSDSVDLRFMVSDTGIGIPQNKLDSIFKSFEQVDGSTTRKYGGTGLGLSISQQLVAMMGGKIFVESPNILRLQESSETEPKKIHPGGPGSTFHFTAHFGLSCAQKIRAPRLDRHDLTGLPVLIVDDNYTNRLLLQEMVTGWGLVPSTAADGKEALELTWKAFSSIKPYRLVLLDMQMPDLDGFDVAKMIKSAPFGKEVKIIMLSSMGQRGDAARCRENGISGYLAKPVKQSDLLDAIMMTMGLQAEEEATVITRHTVYDARERLNILLAEDNMVNQILAIKILESRGHQVTLAANGREAVETFQKDDFDLILMDIQMPEMDGFEATSTIRKLLYEKQNQEGQIAAIPIVAMTAHAMKGDREKCLAAGMDDYVSKPINPEELFRVIKEVIHKTRHQQTENRALKPEAREPISPKTFDLSKTLEATLDDEELFQEITSLFLEGLPGHLDQIKEAIAENDAPALNRAAHSLKGSVGNFQAPKAYEHAYRFELLGNENKVEVAAEEFADLESAFAELAFEMKTVLQDMEIKIS